MSLQRGGCDPVGDRAQHRAAAAALRVCLEHGELSVGGRTGADDGTAAVDLGGAAVLIRAKNLFELKISRGRGFDRSSLRWLEIST
jgi:hypothetical protein